MTRPQRDLGLDGATAHRSDAAARVLSCRKVVPPERPCGNLIKTLVLLVRLQSPLAHPGSENCQWTGRGISFVAFSTKIILFLGSLFLFNTT